MLIQLKDVISIAPDAELTKLSLSDRHKLMDSVLNNEKSRGLSVDFNLSHSARRINSRIYPPRGHQGGLSTWTNPYPKPILRNHDTNEDPLGRLAVVDWISLEHEAIAFFKNVRDYQELVDAYDSDKPKKIYDVMKKFKLFFNKKWPGLGKVAATALITDEKAIEKFLDGRYITFSAGAETDRLACGICGSDWVQGDVCEHRPGRVTEDGEIGVFITGNLHGEEASVINNPADDLGFVTSMVFRDSKEMNAKLSDGDTNILQSDYYLTDSKLMLGVTQMDEETAEVVTESTPEVKVEDQEIQTEIEEVAEKVEDKEVVVETVTKIVETKLFDMNMFELAFEAELLRDKDLSDKVLTDAQKQELDESCFFSDRKIALTDSAHVVAIQRLMKKVTLPEDVQDKLQEFVSSKEKLIQDAKYQQLLADYKQSLDKIKSLEDRLDALENKTEEVKDENLDKNKVSIVDTEQLENPAASVKDSEETFSTGKKVSLSGFEQQILNRYTQILKDSGEEAAEYYLNGKKSRRLISSAFDPKKLMES